MTMQQRKAPAGFVTISDGIHVTLALSSLSVAPPQPNSSAPNVILIFGWIGALTRHLQNYSRKYTELYPHATQVIIECAPSLFWTSERGKQNRLLPVVGALKCLGCLPLANNSAQEPTWLRARILVHSFSSGGALQVASLGSLLASKYPSVARLVSALILDSSPATGTFRSIGLAFGIAIQNPAILYIALPFINLLHALGLVLYKAFGIEPVQVRYSKALLQPRILPWMSSQTPRLYVFSKKDELVPWKAVQQHVDAAKASGLDIRCDVYEESAHVAHMRHDPERYWESVQDLWEVACREGGVRDARTYCRL